MSDAEARSRGVAEFKAYLAAQRHLVSEYPDGADMPQSHYEAISEFWAAINAANPIGLRAPSVICGYDDEDVSEDLRVSLDWSRGRAWLWFSVYQNGKCGITYRNFETDEEVLAEWPTLTEALPRCLALVCRHLEGTSIDENPARCEPGGAHGPAVCGLGGEG